jgi:hypothetical protein
MPAGPGRWKTRTSTHDIIGQCIHHSAGVNVTNPFSVAIYHTGPNHISENGLPGICYTICIPDTDELPWLTSDFEYITSAQGAPDDVHPGDENRHLIPILVMGSFTGPGCRGRLLKPTARQLKHLARVTAWLSDTFDYGTEGIFGHYHFGKPACPGGYLTVWIENMRANGRQLALTEDWQYALTHIIPNCLPKYGIDGQWGNESRRALIAFQRQCGLRVTGVQDAFTELMLMRAMKNVDN